MSPAVAAGAVAPKSAAAIVTVINFRAILTGRPFSC
ncbi:hypothetical protein D806_060900 [Mycolicibacterium smegmatis MKD8]|uniref:Uncharacterized protein n=1 Tax=Mycolicibacterium smegmatis (strain MKD8) TaxID=1214915 RepID=A0A2U9PZ74_MYCSE|nr:hypothetical protein D806_060900 [Mycolicibacterium smegmatis MKD8]